MVRRRQEHFPAASIAEIMRQNAQAQMGTSILSHVRSFQDAASQTPTHFVEKNIDQSYEWNEWALRRRALHMANLRQKVTKSQQTTSSAFRREEETAVEYFIARFALSRPDTTRLPESLLHTLSSEYHEHE